MIGRLRYQIWQELTSDGDGDDDGRWKVVWNTMKDYLGSKRFRPAEETLGTLQRQGYCSIYEARLR